MKEAFLILLGLSAIMAVVVVIVIWQYIKNEPPIYEGMTKGMDESLDNFDDAIDWDVKP